MYLKYPLNRIADFSLVLVYKKIWGKENINKLFGASLFETWQLFAIF